MVYPLDPRPSSFDSSHSPSATLLSHLPHLPGSENPFDPTFLDASVVGVQDNPSSFPIFTIAPPVLFRQPSGETSDRLYVLILAENESLYGGTVPPGHG